MTGTARCLLFSILPRLASGRWWAVMLPHALYGAGWELVPPQAQGGALSLFPAGIGRTVVGC